MRNMEFRAAEIEAVNDLVPEAQKIVKILKGRKTNSAKDAYFYIASVPTEMLVFIEAELPNPKAVSKIRNYLQKWRPLRLALPTAELDALGIARGPKFDKIIEQFFEMQLRGKGKTPEDRTKILRNLGGIKDEPKKVEKPEKKRKGEKGESKAATAPAEGKAPDKQKQTAAVAPAGAAAPSATKARREQPRPSARRRRPNMPKRRTSQKQRRPRRTNQKRTRRRNLGAASEFVTCGRRRNARPAGFRKPIRSARIGRT
jgi:hypothetical protein